MLDVVFGLLPKDPEHDMLQCIAQCYLVTIIIIQPESLNTWFLLILTFNYLLYNVVFLVVIRNITRRLTARDMSKQYIECLIKEAGQYPQV